MIGPKPTKTFRAKRLLENTTLGISNTRRKINEDIQEYKRLSKARGEARLATEEARLDALIAKRERLAAIETKRQKAIALKPKKPRGGFNGPSSNIFDTFRL